MSAFPAEVRELVLSNYPLILAALVGYFAVFLLISYAAKRRLAPEAADYIVASGEHMEGLELWLERGGRLTVRVLSPRGTPLQGRRVRLHPQASGFEVQEGEIGAVSDQTTNAYVEAAFTGMDGGTYLLMTGGKGYEPSRSSIFIGEHQDSRITVDLIPEGRTPQSMGLTQ